MQAGLFGRLLFCLGLATLPAAALGVNAAWSAEGASIAVEAPWSRATPPAAKTGAAYMTLHNSGTAPDRLVAVETPAADGASIHTTVVENNVSSMRAATDGVELPAGGTVTMAPGGTHIMLQGLNKPLVQGEVVSLILVFEQAGRVVVQAPIGPPGAKGPVQ